MKLEHSVNNYHSSNLNPAIELEGRMFSIKT